jgi:hypothetical protein
LPLTSQALVQLCCQEAKVPSWTQQAGQKLNLVLNELCSYDIDVIRQTYQFNFNTALGSGPIPLPTNWLRANESDVFYTIIGVQYVMTPVSMAEFDAFVQQAGLSQYPEYFAVDNSPRQSGLGPNMYVWPPPSGAYPVTARYYSAMADIVAPETSQLVPWFGYESELYLQRRLTGEMLLMANDDRATLYLGGETKRDEGSFLGASAILHRYLSNKDDAQRVQRVSLDKRFFGTPFDKLRNTKTIGW